MDKFKTIKESLQTEVIEKKSKFIANIFYVEDVDQIESIIGKTKRKYFDARHNCFAYRVIQDNKIIEKASDDGEPSGTAGSPMLSILQKNELVNILVIVTRYFGGVLLGTGGLVRAYSNSLIKAIDNSQIILKCIGEELEITLDYNSFEKFKYYCKNNGINIIDAKYTENIVCRIEVEGLTKQKLVNDFETKKIILKNIRDISKKIITKSI